MKSRVTAQVVADLAKVSQSAVSRAFTPGASVAPETRDRILAAAKALGYRPNAIARSLITRRSRMIGLMMSYLENQFYPLVIERLSQILQQRGYHVLLFIGDTDSSDDVITQLLQYQVEGLVMASTMLSSNIAQDCANAGIPVVMFNRVSHKPSGDNLGVSEVTSDNFAGGQMAAKLLLDRGYKRLAYVTGLEDSSTNLDRERGFMSMLGQMGVCLHGRAVGHYSLIGAQNATRQLLQESVHPDGIFFSNDHMAMAGLDVIRGGSGLRVPQDIGVIGFDDVPQASWGSYQLTSVRQDVQAMVLATVELLNTGVKSDELPPARRVIISCKIVERASTLRDC
jgi:DNA-binding LacI/PurR family transcriptional regulator